MPRNNQASRKGHRNHRKPDSLTSEEHNYNYGGYDEVCTSLRYSLLLSTCTELKPRRLQQGADVVEHS